MLFHAAVDRRAEVDAEDRRAAEIEREGREAARDALGESDAEPLVAFCCDGVKERAQLLLRCLHTLVDWERRRAGILALEYIHRELAHGGFETVESFVCRHARKG